MSKLLKLMATQSPDGFAKYLTLYKCELDELTKRKMKKILEQEFQLQSLGTFHSGLADIIQDNALAIKELNAKRNNNGYVFITINPRPDVSFLIFRKKIEKLVNRKMFLKYLYVYEQRGTSNTDAGKGFHAHILAQRSLDYKPSWVEKNIKNTCKGLCDVNNNKLLNIQKIGEDFARDKKIYIMGQNKNGEGKNQKQQLDIIWRNNLGIPSYLGETNII